MLRSTSMDWWQRVPEVMGIAADGPPLIVTTVPIGVPIAVESAEQVA